MLLERVIRLIAPLQRDDVARHFGHQLRVLHDDVAPELHGAAARLHLAVDLEQEIQVDTARAALLDRLFAAHLAQVDRLVAADVELPAAEMRQQLVEDAAHELDAAGIDGAQAERGRRNAPSGYHTHPALRPAAGSGQGQPARHVAEGVLVGHQLDEALAAVGVERQDFLARHRATHLPTPPDGCGRQRCARCKAGAG